MTSGAFRRIAITSLVVGALVMSDTAARAADASDFDPGHIISDTVFYDSASMSEAEIGKFIDARGAACVGTSAVPCLKDYRLSTATRADTWGYCSTYQGAANESAERMIRKVAHACGVSPKVLLVLLEKEQSLLSTTTPTARRYQIATGFGCPDTAGCETAYYGFTNQLFRAARQYRSYQANPNSWSHVAGRVNDVRFHPTSSCGKSPVFIRNQATAGLYNYTPYQPNTSALSNLYGTGDSCSAYGNRNFWRMFTDWFGSTTDVGVRSSPQRDWNGDRLSDLLGTRSTGQLYSYSGTKNSISLKRTAIGKGWSSMRQLTQSYNFLGTSKSEILAVDRSGNLHIYPGDGRGGFGSPRKIGHGWQNFTSIVGVPQWGTTRVPGIMATSASGTLLWYPSNGRGGFSTSKVLSADWGNYDLTAYAGDWDNDGSPDLIARSTDGKLWMVRSASNGSLLEPVQIGRGWDTINEIIGGGDWNQDGNFDLMTTTVTGELYLYPGNGSGTFISRERYGHGWSSFNLIG